MNGDYNGRGNSNGSFGGGFNGQDNNNFGGFNGRDMNSGSFGSDNSQQYNPYEPMYKPENSFDSNTPLYTPAQTPSTVTITKPKQNSNIAVIVAIVLLITVGVGIYFYITYFSHQSIKQFIDSPKGQTLVADLLAEEGTSSQYELKVYANDNNQLICEYKLKSYTPVSQTQKDQMKTYIEAAKPELAKEIQKMMDEYDLKEFSFVYKYVNADDSVFGEYEISLSDRNK